MNCADLEALLCDYVDGTLASAQRAEVELHLHDCPACAEMARDSAAAVSFMERAADVVPPPELLNKILFQLPHGRPAQARRESLARSWKQWLRPVLQPRFAMGMAMTILSFSMLARVAGIRQLSPADLTPAKVWHSVDDRAHRVWERSVKFYESMRVVYEVQTRLREWTEQQQQDRKASEEQTAHPAPKQPEQNQTKSR